MHYSYFSSFSFIFLVFAVAQILKGFGSLQKAKKIHGKRIKSSWVHLIWVLIVFIVIFQYFVGQYQLYNKNIESIPLLLVNLLIPALIYQLSIMIMPELNDADVQRTFKKKEVYSLADYFNRHRKAISLIAIFLVISFAINHVYIGHNLNHKNIFSSYLQTRLPFHLFYILILIFVGYLKDGVKRFWEIQFFLALTGFIIITFMAYQVINYSIFIWHN